MTLINFISLQEKLFNQVKAKLSKLRNRPKTKNLESGYDHFDPEVTEIRRKTIKMTRHKGRVGFFLKEYSFLQQKDNVIFLFC